MNKADTTGDTQLWQSFKKGDEEAFSAIYKAHSPALYAYGMRILQDEDHVKDVMHSLFVKLWNNKNTTGNTDNVRFFLLRALKNAIISYKAREGKTDKIDQWGEALFAFNVTPESIYIQREETAIQANQLMNAINQLSSRQKEIIYLKYFEELDYTEIAEIMDITVKGAYKLSARAIDSLKLIMQSPKSVIIASLISLKALQ